MVFKRQGIHELASTVNVRLTANEKARLQEDASMAAISVSELVRRRSIGSPLFVDANAAIFRELRRIGESLRSILNTADEIHSEKINDAINRICHLMDSSKG